MLTVGDKLPEFSVIAVKPGAMGGHFETQKGAPLILFGLPDKEAETTRYALEIPKLGSLILTHSLDGEVKGLKAWSPEDRPNAAIVFWSFRIMVGLGVLMMAVGLMSLVLRWRRRLYEAPWFHRCVMVMGPAGFAAILAGWVTTEVGRQPYTIYGLLRTAESVSPIGTPGVATTLVAFVAVYLLVFGAGVYYMLRLMARAPQVSTAKETPESRIPRADITVSAATPLRKAVPAE